MRNRVLQLALGLVFLGILVQVVLIAPSQIRDSEKAAEAAKTSPAPSQSASGAADPSANSDQSINGMHMIETQEGRKEWELWADRATSVKAKDTVLLEKPRALIFAETGATFTVTGDKGSVETKTKNLTISGNVVTHTSNGYVFKTESLDYTSETRMLVGNAPVEMDGPHDTQGHFVHLNGVGVRASLKKNQLEVMNDLHAEKGLESNRTVYISSHRALFSSADRSAKFIENVILDMETMRITGPEAIFNYAPNSDVVKSVLFAHGARVSDTDKFATAQNVLVDFQENKFIFTGEPRVVQNNDELRGDEIVFLDGGKEVEVRKARARVDEKRMEKKN